MDRYRDRKIKTHVSGTEFYEFYKKDNFYIFNKEDKSKRGHINKKSKYYISYKDFNKITDEFNLEIRNKIINYSLDFNFPYGIGDFIIRKHKPTIYISKTDNKLKNGNRIDWNTSVNLWRLNPGKKKKVVRFDNNHSDGYIIKPYFKRKYCVKYSYLYSFRPCRKFNRTIAKAIKENPKIDFYLK